MKTFIRRRLHEELIDGEKMNKGTQVICDKLTIDSYEEALHYVKAALKGLEPDVKERLIQKILSPLKNIKQQQEIIGSEIKKYHMSGDSMPDEADTYWTEIQTAFCDAGPEFE